jgi:DNA (cytosine-5)-methyltransferase 1
MTIPVIDLFAGPGGLGEGFETEGNFRVSLSVECDPFAHKTLLLRSFFRQFQDSCTPDEYYEYIRGEISRETLFATFPKEEEAAKKIAIMAKLGETNPDEIDSMVDKALKALKGPKNLRTWILIGGPPCQAYSLVGRSRRTRENRDDFEKDTRHYLYREYLRILAKHQPAIFVMENVKGILSAKLQGNRIFSQICDDLSGAGYSLYGFSGDTPRTADQNSWNWNPNAFLIKSEEHGIPQKRHRVFILGVRNDLINCEMTPKRLKLPKSKIKQSVFNTIGGLPKIWSSLSSRDTKRRGWIKARDLGIKAHSHKSKASLKIPTNDRGSMFVVGEEGDVFNKKWFLDKRIQGVLNHEARTHISKDISRYAFASSFAKKMKRSPSIYEFPKWLLPKHKNVHDTNVITPFADRFRVQLRDQPSSTVTSHISKDGHYYIHFDPDQARSLSVREAARLQTFPDNYFFEGPRTQQYHQVGNAVPPLLASKIARIVAKILKKSVV